MDQQFPAPGTQPPENTAPSGFPVPPVSPSNAGGAQGAGQPGMNGNPSGMGNPATGGSPPYGYSPYDAPPARPTAPAAGTPVYGSQQGQRPSGWPPAPPYPSNNMSPPPYPGGGPANSFYPPPRGTPYPASGSAGYGYYGPAAGPYPAPVQPMPAMENGVPIHPYPDERKWIKHFYNWTGGILLIHAGILQLAAVIAVFLFVAFSGGITSLNQPGYQDMLVYVNAIAYPILNIGAVLLGCAITKIKIRDFFSGVHYGPGTILGGAAVGWGWQALTVVGASFILGLLGQLGYEPQTGVEPVSMGAKIVMLVYSCLLAPITEELLFRGFCLKNLGRVNMRMGILASALLFGLVHGNGVQFFLAVGIGIVLAYITHKSGTLIPAIIIHVAINSVVTILDYLYQWNESLAMVQWIWFGIAFVAGLAVFLYAVIKKKVRLPSVGLAKKARGWPIFFTSPTLWVFIAFYGVLIILPLLRWTLIH